MRKPIVLLFNFKRREERLNKRLEDRGKDLETRGLKVLVSRIDI
jgi:hypothetical protein